MVFEIVGMAEITWGVKCPERRGLSPGEKEKKWTQGRARERQRLELRGRQKVWAQVLLALVWEQMNGATIF